MLIAWQEVVLVQSHHSREPSQRRKTSTSCCPMFHSGFPLDINTVPFPPSKPWSPKFIFSLSFHVNCLLALLTICYLTVVLIYHFTLELLTSSSLVLCLYHTLSHNHTMLSIFVFSAPWFKNLLSESIGGCHLCQDFFFSPFFVLFFALFVFDWVIHLLQCLPYHVLWWSHSLPIIHWGQDQSSQSLKRVMW